MNYTTESFIKAAKEKRFEKNWGFEKVTYINSHTKVCITCPIHGDFLISPTNFLSGKGCKKCALENRKRKSNEQIICEFKKIHGDVYDYSKVEYKSPKEKIIVICPKHGEFLISPDKHLQGHGCQKCSKEKNSNLGYFLEKSPIVHKNKYDYSKVEYKGNNRNVRIICPKHGDFWMTPGTHLNGKGCPKCAKEENEALKKIEKEAKEKQTKIKKENNFITKSKKIHGDKYDYSKVKYVKSTEKVCIICPEHGEFWQTPNAHLSGKGCPKCAGIGKTNNDIINEFKKIHGDTYDYSKFNYVKAKEKVCIICKKHGEFWITPNKHLMGQGCPICKESKLEKEVRLFLTDNNIKFIQKANKKDVDWIGLQHLDFYLPDYNVAIECQGKQHLFKSENFGSKIAVDEAFQNILKRDKIKNGLCAAHKLTLVYLIEKRYKKTNLDNDVFNGIYTKHNTYYDMKKLAREMQLI